MLTHSALKLSILSFLFFWSSSVIFSQTQKKPKFGKISIEQLQKKKDDAFPDAHAVVLFDYGDAYYKILPGTGEIRVNIDRHIAIQFFDNTEFDIATFEEALYHHGGNTKEVLTRVKGVTYNLENGKIVETKLSKKDIIKEKVDDNLDLKKFTMPNVKQGSIIEVKYNIGSDYFWNMDQWYFQSSIPTRYSEYNIEVPDFFNFSKNFLGAFSPHIKLRKKTTDGDFLSWTEGWAMTDLPAFEEEAYMRSYKNYMSKIEFELKSVRYNSGTEYYTSSWAEINKDLKKDDDFGAQIKKRRAVGEIVSQYEGKSEEEKLLLIYEHIKNKMKWDGKLSVVSEKGVNKSLDEGKGNSGDINLALIAALKHAGYKVSPVVLSTRDNGMLPLTSPSRDKLNYVIAAVEIGDKMHFLDATDNDYPMTLLPRRCFNGEVILMGDDKIKSFELKSVKKSKSVIQNTLTLSDDGIFEGMMKKVKSGYSAIDFRKEFRKADDENTFVEEMQNDQEGLTIESHTIENIDDIYKNIKEEYQVTYEGKAEMTGDLIYLNPMMNSGMDENPFKLEERQYPVDYAIPIDNIYMLKFTIPEGYTIESVPENAVIALPEKATQFTYDVKETGGIITVSSRFKVNKTLFLSNEYEALKEFYNIVIKKHSEQIVLKKN